MRHLSIYEQNLYECVKIYGSWLGQPLGIISLCVPVNGVRGAAGHGRAGWDTGPPATLREAEAWHSCFSWVRLVREWKKGQARSGWGSRCITVKLRNTPSCTVRRSFSMSLALELMVGKESLTQGTAWQFKITQLILPWFYRFSFIYEEQSMLCPDFPARI